MNRLDGQRLMTVGELSRRTGLTPKSIRELEDLRPCRIRVGADGSRSSSAPK